MSRFRTPLIPLALTGVLVVAGLGCDNQLVQTVENTPPRAQITSPAEIGRGQLLTLDGSASFDPNGRIQSYRWTFGDMSPTFTSTTPAAFHTYNELGTFEIQLFVVDNDSATDTATATIVVTSMPTNQPPVARIVAPSEGQPLIPITFDGRSSSDADGSITDWAWEIEGIELLGQQVSHTFGADGSYEVTLTVTDDRGAKGTASHTVTVGSAQQIAPVADAGGDQAVNVGEMVTFDGRNSFDADGTIIDYQWDFGDGAVAVGARAMHTYNTDGAFGVTLTVEDNDGLTDTASVTITVGTPMVEGTYTLEANPSTGMCLSPGDATFVATTITFTVNGGVLTASQPDPERPGMEILMTGTLAGASFSVSGTWVDSQTADHAMTLTGTFMGRSYSGTFRETISVSGFPICTVTWPVTGNRL